MIEGYAKKPAEYLPAGWYWVEYEDGCGSLYGPNGERMFCYDKNSREIQDIGGDYRRYDLCVKSEMPGLERKLLEELESAEGINMENVCPIMYVNNDCMNEPKYYILPAGNWIIEAAAFADLASRVANAELAQSADHGIRPYALGAKIVAAAETADKQFRYEGSVFSVKKILHDGKLFRRGSDRRP